ncbi:MAG: hypothetical protein ACFFCP_10830 [Promethearchaeota archaeon]
MSDSERDATLRSILRDAAKSGDRLRFYGHGMMIIAEGSVAFVGKDVVGLKHGKTEEADEFISIECIIKVQILGEYRQY